MVKRSALTPDANHEPNDFKMSRRGFLKIGALTAAGLGTSFAANARGVPAAEAATAGSYDSEVNSCCQFCQVRCTTKVQVKDGRVVNVYGNPDNFWTKGGMCPKGQSMVELTYSPHRLLYPLKRDGQGWSRISYPEAVDLVAERIRKLKADSPEDYAHQVVLFAPLWESRESELAATMAMSLAGFPDICHPGDVCIGNSAAALRICLGSPITPTTLDEVLNSQLLVLWGANIAEIYPLYIRWTDQAREKGVKILYIDPRRTPTSNHCDEQLALRPGTDGAFALGVIRILIKEKLYDARYVERHVNGLKELVEACESYTPDRVAKLTWISEGKLIEVARQLGQSQGTIVWLGGSLSRYTNSIQTVRAIIALQAITGNLSGSGKGMMNVQGGKPGGGEGFEERFRSRDLEPGLSFRKILYNMERGKVKMLLLNSSYRRYPDAERVKSAIAKVDFVVYRGFFMDEEAALAHLIIPATMVFESAGSQYGAQRQVVWREKAIASPGETVEDWRFYRDLSKKVSGEAFPPVESAEDVYELFRKYSSTWAGLALDRVRKDPSGISWPCPSMNHSGTKGTLYPGDRFLTGDGNVELRSGALGLISWSEPGGSPLSDPERSKTFPLIFLQGKVVHHWQHTYTNWSSYLAQFSEGNYVQIHPETAHSFGLREGDWAYLETERGKIKVRAKLSELIFPGIIWTPSHPESRSPFRGNSGQSINTIVPGYWDQVSAQFNGFGCRLVKIEDATHRA
ncbi:MAG TPA: molybdopterin-dependent oxidoreductase [Thermodesulfobacteriota bacterium]|nr:molybdopterin-dependent oxidoreductase [Thermodesulfobacteriota bacterium]